MNDTIDISVIVQQLRRTREAQGLTQRDLGAKFGVSKQRLSNWERGSAPPALDMLVRWAASLGVTLEVGGDDQERQKWLSLYDELTLEERELVQRMARNRRFREAP